MTTEDLISPAVIITTTSFPDLSLSTRVRMDAALKSLKLARSLNYRVITVDHMSPEPYLAELRRIGVEVLVQQGSTMGASRREALSAALGTEAKYFVYMEAEKAGYVKEIAKTLQPLAGGAADIVVPARHSCASYPRAQQHAEALGNEFWRRLSGLSLDLWFGPRSLRRECSAFFLDYRGEFGDSWECIFVPIVDAVKSGARLLGVTVEYEHPREQTEAEEEDPAFVKKRITQLEHISSALERRWKGRRRC